MHGRGLELECLLPRLDVLRLLVGTVLILSYVKVFVLLVLRLVLLMRRIRRIILLDVIVTGHVARVVLMAYARYVVELVQTLVF